MDDWMTQWNWFDYQMFGVTETSIEQVFLVESIKLAALQSHGPSFQI